MHRTMSLAAAMAALTCTLSAQVLVAPTGYDVLEGGTNNTFPWSRGTASMRIQFCYDSSNFTNGGVTGITMINRMRFRADAVAATTSWAGGTWPRVTIDMSTAATDFLGVTTTFASNHGLDRVTVLDGPVTVSGGTGNGAGIPGPWYIDIALSRPFLYDPSSGNDLLVDIQLDGTGWTGTSRTADHVSGVGSLGSRIYDSTSNTPNGTTGVVGTNYLPVTEFTCTTPAGLYASFNASVTTGASPLAVNFTDNSLSVTPGGITTWAWDFDGDSIIDSNLQNPSHVYSSCGSYTVSLTVNDGVNPPSTLTRTNLIVTDIVTPGFTSALIAPGGVVQFTDTSTPTPTSWAWDLDGDGITDSTVQNPVWNYGTTCGNAVNVRLTVNRLCRGPYTLTRPVFPASMLETRRDGNTSTSTGAGGYFDVNVTNPLGIVICKMEMKTTAAANAALVFDVFVTPNTFVGNTGNLAAWHQIATVNTTGALTAADLELLTFNPPLYLPAGNWGMHVRCLTTSAQYGTISGATTYSNPDLTLTLGSVGVLGSTAIANRLWNGSFVYSTCATGGEAGYGYLGAGCAGSLGVSRLTNANRPVLGQTLQVTASNLPVSGMFLIFGFSNTTSVFGPLPLDLSPFGAPGCFARVSSDAANFIAGAGNSATWNFTLPNNPRLLCGKFYNQALAIDPGFNTLGASISDAAVGVIGSL